MGWPHNVDRNRPAAAGRALQAGGTSPGRLDAPPGPHRRQAPRSSAVVFSRGPLFVLLCAVTILFGCVSSEPSAGTGPAPAAPTAAATSQPGGKVAHALPPARKIVRKAELTLEVVSASDAQAEAARIVEGHGGYVASSEDQSSAADGRAASSVTLVLRVPAAKFGLALAQLRKLGRGSAAERINSDDVTEEFIDLEARLRNQRALEQRFLEILKTAGKVEEALQVEREVASVRTEIDRLEGRRRFLERETELSTITLSFSTVEPLIRASFSDFGSSIERAYGDSITVGARIISGGIRFAGLFLPVLMLVGVPAVLMVRFLARRARKAAPGV